MALSEDQIALLRLLLAGDTYERVAAVLGIDPDEVKARAHAAAAALTDEPNAGFPLEVVNSRLAELEGAADPYPPPAVPHPRPTVATTPLSRRWAVWLAAGGAVVIVAVVALLVVSGGAEEDGGFNPTPDREDIVPVMMSPVGGSRASGTIAIVRAGDQPAVDLALRGLQPSRAGETYVLWFVGSGNRALPVAFQAVGRDRRLTGRAPIPSAASSLLPSFETAELTLAGGRQAAAALQRAGQSGTLPQPVGTAVLRGTLP
jgi:hypothetical protein